jgi:hypothetical protein
VALYEPMEGLGHLLLRFMDLKEFNTGIVFLLMPVVQG